MSVSKQLIHLRNLKGILDIYSQHDSKAGNDMSAEVSEILDNVHQMSQTKRILIRFGILLLAVMVIIGIIFLIRH